MKGLVFESFMVVENGDVLFVVFNGCRVSNYTMAYDTIVSETVLLIYMEL